MIITEILRIINCRGTDRTRIQNANFFISHRNPMVRPLVRIVSTRRFERWSRHRISLRNKEVMRKNNLKTQAYLLLCQILLRVICWLAGYLVQRKWPSGDKCCFYTVVFSNALKWGQEVLLFIFDLPKFEKFLKSLWSLQPSTQNLLLESYLRCFVTYSKNVLRDLILFADQI